MNHPDICPGNIVLYRRQRTAWPFAFFRAPRGNYYGLYFPYTSSTVSCLITYNLFQDNENFAIFIGSSNYGNIIHHNSFINNAVNRSSQANDNELNTWYDTENNEGNFWSDWSGIGAYSIAGITFNEDPYPLENRPV